MHRINWNAVIRSLLLVRFGQELGTVGPLSRAIHDTLDLLAAVAGLCR